MTRMEQLLGPVSGLRRPKAVLLVARVNFDAVLHAPLARYMRQTDGTKFVVWVGSHKRKKEWDQWTDGLARIEVEEDVWRRVEDEPFDEIVEFETARKREARYAISYLRHILHQDKGTAANYLQHSPNSAFAKARPRSFPRLVKGINLMFDAVERAVDQDGVELIVARNSGIFNSVANAVARDRRIPCSWLNHLRTGKLMTWMEGPDHGDRLTRRVMGLLPPQAPVAQEEVVPPDDTQWALDRVSREHRWDVVGRQLYSLTKHQVAHSLIDLKRGRKGARLPFRGSVQNIFSRRAILKHLEDIAETDEKNITNTPFALFLLHLDPEYTSSTLARDFNHLHAIVQQLALSLPVGMRLVIKEHVWGLGNRDQAFYDSLRHLPNVVFADHRIRSTRLAARAAFVSTIAGTIAIEASLIGTPVIIFVPYVEYANFKNVQVVRNIAELPVHVARALEPRSAADALAARVEAATFREAQKVLSFDLPDLELSADGNMNRDVDISRVELGVVTEAHELLLRIMNVQLEGYSQMLKAVV